jgi:N-acylneuraminate cytidylyltransferase
LKKGFDLFTQTNFDVVFPVVKYSYPIQRSLRKESDGKVAMLWPENYPKRSQDLEPVFHDAGQFYWFKSEYILRVGKLFGDNVGGLVIDEMSVQDIDNESDWEMAEFKYHFIKKTEGKGE